jgi:hypothetical protein
MPIIFYLEATQQNDTIVWADMLSITYAKCLFIIYYTVIMPRVIMMSVATLHQH